TAMSSGRRGVPRATWRSLPSVLLRLDRNPCQIKAIVETVTVQLKLIQAISRQRYPGGSVGVVGPEQVTYCLKGVRRSPPQTANAIAAPSTPDEALTSLSLGISFMFAYTVGS